MIAYTAWDSVQAIARQFDASLDLAPAEHLVLGRSRQRFVSSASVRRVAARLRAGFAGFRSRPATHL